MEQKDKSSHNRMKQCRVGREHALMYYLNPEEQIVVCIMGTAVKKWPSCEVLVCYFRVTEKPNMIPLAFDEF
ncbi:hypothetical protein chiPu_0014960 [Chiloscyllium punctatum]|uniref:Uncharacterized protein n=1 Tax=Chiloscyllium punctatum TaxID=137246 RepID=A0A401T1D9_CHIPU|nr:hypothetical protein [Chiloscyllium punctatum]